MPTYLGINDDYLPSIPKPSLQQYDNYQIHDLICSDSGDATSQSMKGKYWLAIERVSPHESIPINFTAIALLYP